MTQLHGSEAGAQTDARYKIVRFYQNGTKRTIKTGLYLFEAQSHCRDPETSSRTCRGRAGLQRTKHHGPWSDGYELMNGKRR